jgi:hypothetical protein
VGTRAGLDACGKSRTTGIQSPGRPVRSESLYRLFYPSPHIYGRVDYVFSQSIKLLFLIASISFSFCILDRLLMMCFSIVRPKLERESVLWN